MSRNPLSVCPSAFPNRADSLLHYTRHRLCCLWLLHRLDAYLLRIASGLTAIEMLLGSGVVAVELCCLLDFWILSRSMGRMRTAPHICAGVRIR